MTWHRRVANIIKALICIIAALAIFAEDDAAQIIITILGISVVFYGLRNIFFYFGMARYMVGGKSILYRGILATDFGLFTGLIATVPEFYGMIYLLVIKAFSGIVGILRAFEAKKLRAGNWKFKFAVSVINLMIVALCLVMIDDENVFVLIYCIGMINSAIGSIVAAFRKTAMVYIQ